MAYNRAQALKICSATEMEIFLSSLSDAVGKLTPVQLRSRIARARTLRDKNTDLFRRQVAATRAATGTKRGASGTANSRTEQKAQLFAEALARLEARQTAIDAKPVKAVASKSGSKATKATKAKRAPAAPAMPKKSVAKRVAAKAAKPAVKPVAKKPVAKKPVAKKPVARKAAPRVAKAAASKATKPTSAKTAKPVAAKAVKPAAKPAAPKSRKKVSGPVPAKSLKAPVAKIGNPVSPVVKLRGKVIGAHARSAGARNEARRGKR
jgi:histone H1/5